MYNKPDNHIDYIIECLVAIQLHNDTAGGEETARLPWDKFIPKLPPLPKAERGIDATSASGECRPTGEALWLWQSLSMAMKGKTLHV